MKINETLENVMPPLEDRELDILTQSILKEGCRDPLVVWKETGEIVDGHNRYRICKEYAIPFKVKEISFSNKGDAIAWAIKNQIGRRNLTAFQRCEMIFPFEATLRAEAKKRQGWRSDLKGKCGTSSIDTRSILADMAGVSHGTLTTVKKILEIADSETLRRVRKGEISINYAYRSLLPVFEPMSARIPIEEKPVDLSPIYDLVKNLHDRIYEGDMTTKAILAELSKVAQMIEEAKGDG